MSLIWHLRNHLESPVGEFLYQRLSHTKRITLQTNKKLKRGDCPGLGMLQILPYRPLVQLGLKGDLKTLSSLAI